MVLGFALTSFAQEGPVLDKVWAAAEVNIGSLCKIYVKAHDPNGDMRWVIVSASRPEQMQPSGATQIRLKKGIGTELNGYLYFDTSQAKMKGSSGSVKVFIAIEDWKGNESETQSVTIKFLTKGAKAFQMPTDFKEAEIGPIIITSPAQGFAP